MHYFTFFYLFEHAVIYDDEGRIFKIILDIRRNYDKIKDMEYKTNNDLSDLIMKRINGDIDILSLPLYKQGTSFQNGVWKEIAKVPFGEVITYKQLSERVGTRGYRAVGVACGKNPFPILIPCHRIVAKNGIGGFSGDIYIKKTILKYEMEEKYDFE